MTRQKLLGITLTTLFVTACGGASPDTSSSTTPAPAGQTVVVATTPAETSVSPGVSVKFTVQVTGTADTTVRWSVDEADGGTIDANGLYTAPTTEGTYHVTAEHVTLATASPTASASKKDVGKSVVHVSKNSPAQPITVTVTPGTATVPAGGTLSFAAAVTGTTTRTVTWTVQEGSSCGSVSAAGVYTAPSAGATCRLVATSVADATKSATATITVTPPAAPPAVAISISPTTVTLDACKGQVFAATVTNASNTAVTWTVTEAGGGTVTSGAYVAPTVAGIYHVVAVSQADPSKTAQATITVGPEKVLSVAVAPGSGTVNANGQLAFAANVTTTCGTFAAQ